MIFCLDFCEGRNHDFDLFKKSRLPIKKESKLLADTGYLGVKKIHTKSEHPLKSSKHHPLTKADKQYNRALSKERIAVENVIANLKRFRILAGPYRNRRSRFTLRMNLIAGIYNYELLN